MLLKLKYNLKNINFIYIIHNQINYRRANKLIFISGYKISSICYKYEFIKHLIFRSFCTYLFVHTYRYLNSKDINYLISYTTINFN